VDKRKVQVISFTSTERARQPFFDPVKHGQLMADKLAYDVLADIMSIINPTNYPGSTLAAMASTSFDENDVADREAGEHGQTILSAARARNDGAIRAPPS
jgi:hypothetical protein